MKYLSSINDIWVYLSSKTDYFKENNLTDDYRISHCFRQPGIVNFYRPPNLPWRYYLYSIFTVHNETLNIWTHLVGCLVLSYVLRTYSLFYNNWEHKDSWPILIFGICCILTHILSVIAHTFHSKSEKIHYDVFFIDYMGVTFYAFGTGVMAFNSCVDKDAYVFFGSSYLPLLTVITSLNYILLCYAKLNYVGSSDEEIRKRKLIQICTVTGQVLLITVPFAPRYIKCYIDSTCSLSSFNHITVTFGLLGLQGFFFGSHIPEIFSPGTFDIACQSHQLFHIMATTTQIFQMRAVHKDIQGGNPEFVQSSFVVMFGSLITLVIIETVALVFIRKFVPNSLRKTC